MCTAVAVTVAMSRAPIARIALYRCFVAGREAEIWRLRSACFARTVRARTVTYFDLPALDAAHLHQLRNQIYTWKQKHYNWQVCHSNRTGSSPNIYLNRNAAWFQRFCWRTLDTSPAANTTTCKTYKRDNKPTAIVSYSYIDRNRRQCQGMLLYITWESRQDGPAAPSLPSQGPRS